MEQKQRYQYFSHSLTLSDCQTSGWQREFPGQSRVGRSTDVKRYFIYWLTSSIHGYMFYQDILILSENSSSLIINNQGKNKKRHGSIIFPMRPSHSILKIIIKQAHICLFIILNWFADLIFCPIISTKKVFNWNVKEAVFIIVMDHNFYLNQVFPLISGLEYGIWKTKQL